MKSTIALLLLGLFSLTTFAQTITKPEDFFGFKPGSDRMLFGYGQLIDYLKKIDSQSDKVKLMEIGMSPMGKPMYALFVSSGQNIANLDRLKEINRRLALDYSMGESERNALVGEGKVFVLATLSMHSTEVAPAQALPLIVYNLATATDPNTQKILNDVVYMAVPNHNPDGMDMIVDYYNRTKGTRYEGSSMPGVYHKYVGHDNNRDFVVLTQSDTKAVSALTSTTWFPQVMVEKHQMGSTGPRYFVPPYHDPIAENLEAEIFTWNGLFGQNMVNDMTARGLLGVSQHTLFDDYWPGSTETCIWKNVIGFLTEAASVQIATPVFVEPTELRGGGKGLAEYKKGTNFLAPWPGGWWHLSDIVDLEIGSTQSILTTAMLYKERILAFRNDMCKRQVAKGQSEAPFYFIMPENQRDPSELVSLVNLLREHGVEVYRLTTDITLGRSNYHKGDIVVPLAQPFRAFVKEVMEEQKYPERHFTPDGELIEPYDITSWSLPLHKGLTCNRIDVRDRGLEASLVRIEGEYSLANSTTSYEYAILPASNNQAFKLAFDAISQGISVSRASEGFVVGNVPIEAGSFIIKKQPKFDDILKTACFPVHYAATPPQVGQTAISMPRIALVETYMHDMDAGWTRFVLDSYGIKYTVLRPGDFEATDLKSKFDVVMFPNTNASILKDGKMKREGQYFVTSYPPEYTKGMGAKGFESLMGFLSNGGIIVSWGQSTELFEGQLTIKDKTLSEDFQLPFRNEADRLEKKGLQCPGSLVRMNLLPNHPLTWGMGYETGIFYRGNPAFTTQVPVFDMDRRVIGYFGEENVLLSGYLEGGKLLYNKSAMVWLRKGKGQLVLFGFSPIFRASVPGNYKLLFNSILLPRIQ
jgi:hypothetical protein